MTMDPHAGLAGDVGSAGGCPFKADNSSAGISADSIVPLLSMHLAHVWEASNASLHAVDPLLLILLSVSGTVLLAQALSLFLSAHRTVREKGLFTAIQVSAIAVLKKLPGVAERIRAEQQKMVDKVQGSLSAPRDGWMTALPENGLSQEAIFSHLDELKAKDKRWKGRCSGTVYIGGASYDAHMRLVSEAYMGFAHTNPLHPDVFPSVVRMENEVVAMTGHLLGAGSGSEEEERSARRPRGCLPDALGTQEVCGNVTSGGTESILMAVKVAREYMRDLKGITKPELVMAESAHAAYDKACEYFGITLRRAPVRADYRADVKAMKSLINRNTIIIVGSAPGFPHGVVDPIEELGKLALRYGVCLHVDCCLGGFVLPFARHLGYPIPPFDFRVPGVTSISVDTHKYGLAPKGTSIVLYRTHELRRFQYVAVTEWTGGMYVSPSVAGSRSGGLIAGAWAALVAQGLQGFLRSTADLMESSRALRNGIDAIEGLYVMGEPDMTVVAFGTRPVAEDVYRVNDAMSARGWNLNALQRPPSVHMCITLQHVEVIDQFLSDLAASAEEVRNNPKAFMSGMAPVYGAAAKIPDRVAVKDFLVNLMESSC